MGRSPKIYPGRKFTPREWIEEHYIEQLRNGSLTRSKLLSDQKLYEAYAKWIKRHPQDDLKLPKGTRKDALPAEEAVKRRRSSSRANYHRNKDKQP